MTELATNVLYYGDNLDILRHDPPYIPPESVDLIYLDPPFNSNATYNVIFKDESGQRSDAQIVAFDDTWHWGPKAEEHYLYLTNSSHHKGRVPSTLSDLIGAFHSGIRPSPMLAYVVEMAVRLVELHRTLKPTGSMYLHCDPTASHYLKLVLDAVFGPQNFRNEIIWRRTGSNNNAKRFGPIHQTIFYYAKSESTEFNQFWLPYTRAYVESAFSLEDERGRYQSVALTGPGTREGESGKPWRGYSPTSVGRHWQPASYLYRKYVALTGEDLADYPLLERLDKLDEVGLIHRPTPKHAPRYRFYLEDAPGVPAQDIWAHQPGTRGVVYGSKEEIDEAVSWLNVRDAERLRWPTQKPVGLLERIIRASSKPGDVVFDPFCGCGTALVAAQKLGREWIGIDITILSIAVMQGRLRDSFGIIAPIEGSPTEVEGARKLAEQKPNGREQFELWALTLVGATPVGGVQKKGADRGVDGVITFTGVGGKVETCIVSVKSGHVTRAQVAELKGDMASQGAVLGLFVTLDEPTAPMRREATEAGFYHSDLSGMDYPVVQICTIRQLLEEGKKPMLPLLILPAYQQAEKIDEVSPGQQELFGGVS